MATVTPIPKVVCDCCGISAEKTKDSFSENWRRPSGWQTLNCPASYFGTYPNNINFPDVCPKCCKAINAAVSAAIDEIPKAQKEPTS